MIFDLFQAIMNDINDIMNDKKGHNIINDIEQLCLSQTAYLLCLSLKEKNTIHGITFFFHNYLMQLFVRLHLN